jgi:hypothetical protein
MSDGAPLPRPLRLALPLRLPCSDPLPLPSCHLAFPTGAFNDWNKDRQFQKLNALKDVIEVKVVRGGQQVTVANTDVVVGDVLLLEAGDKVVADGYTVEVSVSASCLVSMPTPRSVGVGGRFWS